MKSPFSKYTAPEGIAIHPLFTAGDGHAAAVQIAAGARKRVSASPEILQQLRNVASLPGVAGPVWLLPNGQPGLAFPYGAVVTADPDEGGVVTPMAVGPDPYCGVRLLAIDVERRDLEDRLHAITQGLARTIPIGRRGILRSPSTAVPQILYRGARWATDQGFGDSNDLRHVENGGCLVGADPAVLSPHARAIGEDQLGTLGTGHHFIELSFVSDVLEPGAAQQLGLQANQALVWIHAGSRGLGQQVLNEYQRVMSRAAARHLIRLPDRQLYCAPIHSHEGREYLAAMAAAGNFAFANRQILAHRIAEVLRSAFGGCAVRTVYEQCHNTISLEVQPRDGIRKRLCVHRRACGRSIGSTPAPQDAACGQPVFLMGHCSTASLAGVATDQAADLAFGSLPTGCGLRAPDEAPPVGDDAGPQTLLISLQGGRAVAPPPNAVRDIEPVAQTLAATGAVEWAVRTRALAVLRG